MSYYSLSSRKSSSDLFAGQLFRNLLTCSLLVVVLTAVFPAISFAAEPAPTVPANSVVSLDDEPASEEAAEPDSESEPVEEAEEDSGPVEKNEHDAFFVVNNLWIMIAGMLVFIMHLGFATLESGLTRSKNTVNILFKNTMIVCIGLITYLSLIHI